MHGSHCYDMDKIYAKCGKIQVQDSKDFIQPYIVQRRYISFTEIKHYIKENDYITKIINRT